MSAIDHRFDGERVPAPASRLRPGVVIAALLFGVGPLAALWAHGAAEPEPRWFVALTTFLAAELLAALVVVLGRRWRTAAVVDQTRRTERVLAAIAEGVIVAGADGRIALANDAARRMLGPPPEDGRACRWMERARLVGPDGEAPCDEERNPVLRALHGTTVADESWTIAGERDRSSLLVSARPLTAAGDGEAQGAVVVVRDVTESRRLAAESERLSRAVEQTADAVVITDKGGAILYVNPGFEQITGWRREEVTGKNPRILNSGHHPRSEFERLWSTIARGEVYRNTLVNKRRDGSLYPAEQTITPLREPGGAISHFVSVSKDMTEHHRLVANEIELRIAADVQRRLYPAELPRIAGLEIAGRSFAAASAGGDYYDVLPRAEGGVAVVVADVSGHGVGPALIMAETRAYVRSLASSALDPGRLLSRVDAMLAPDIPAETFITALFVDVEAASRRIRYANAGHVAAIVVGADGRRSASLTGTGRPLGLTDGHPISSREGPVLHDGDVLVLVTDGVTDVLGHDEEPCDDDDLAALVAPVRGQSASAIVRSISDRVFLTVEGASRRDDVTVLVVKAVAS